MRKLSAVWLVALVLSPFTAPFQTCELAVLGRHIVNQQMPITPPIVKTRSREDAATSLLDVPLTTDELRMHLIASLISITAQSGAGPSPATFLQEPNPSPGAAGPLRAQPAILRV